MDEKNSESNKKKNPCSAQLASRFPIFSTSFQFSGGIQNRPKTQWKELLFAPLFSHIPMYATQPYWNENSPLETGTLTPH
jgi:hypothetical protein